MPRDILPSATAPRRSRVPGLADLRTPPMSYDALVLSDSPIAFWKLNELSGTTAYDATGNGHGGTYENSPQLGEEGLIDRAVRLNGTNQNITVANATGLPTTGQYTLEAIMFQEGGTAQTVVGYGDWGTTRGSNRLFVADTRNLGAYWWFDDYNALHSGIYNAWHHIASTWDGSLRRVYVDGVLLGTGNTPAGSPAFVAANLFIGRSTTTPPGSAPQQFFGGRLQRVAIYGTALSAAKLLAHKKAAFGW